jgi:drug/metabolite transporter (DMT)-like permease
MLLAICGYVLFAVCVRILRDVFSIFEIAAFRSLGAIAFCSFVVARKPFILDDLRSIDIKLHAARSALQAAGTLAIVGSIALVPLGLVSALEFTGPIFAAIFVFVLTRALPERLSWLGLGAIFVGALALVAQFLDDFGPAVLLPIAGTAALTMTNMMLARLAAKHYGTTIMLVMALLQLPLYLLGALFWGKGFPLSTLGPLEIAAVAGIAVTGFATQMALAKATRYGSDLQVSALDVMRIPAVAIVAYVFFAEQLNLEANLQILLVMAGVCILAFVRKKQSGTPA